MGFKGVTGEGGRTPTAALGTLSGRRLPFPLEGLGASSPLKAQGIALLRFHGLGIFMGREFCPPARERS